MNTPGLVSRFSATYTLFIRAASSLRSPLLLVFRLYWGWSFFQTGLGKLQHLDVPTGFFTQLGIPFPHFNAVLVGCTECAGGVLLLLGLAARLTAVPLIITMIVAYLTADREALVAFFSDQEKFIGSDPITYLMITLVILAFGPGVFSIDHLLEKNSG